MNIKDFLTEREKQGENLIGVRKWATEQAERKFKTEYEDILPFQTIYEQPDIDNCPEEWRMNEKYTDIFEQMVEDFEDDILEYQSDLYD